jgi:hypothetical protein
VQAAAGFRVEAVFARPDPHGGYRMRPVKEPTPKVRNAPRRYKMPKRYLEEKRLRERAMKVRRKIRRLKEWPEWCGVRPSSTGRTPIILKLSLNSPSCGSHGKCYNVIGMLIGRARCHGWSSLQLGLLEMIDGLSLISALTSSIIGSCEATTLTFLQSLFSLRALPKVSGRLKWIARRMRQRFNYSKRSITPS